jgi:hypothetical protein
MTTKAACSALQSSVQPPSDINTNAAVMPVIVSANGVRTVVERPGF